MSRWYYLPTHCLYVNVLLSNIIFYDFCGFRYVTHRNIALTNIYFSIIILVIVTKCKDLFTANCTASHPQCETIWNTDVQQLYHNLSAGTLRRDQLQAFCRFVILYYHAVMHTYGKTARFDQLAKLQNSVISRGMGNLPTNFGVSRTFRSRPSGQHLSYRSRHLATLTFDLGYCGACR